MGYENESISKLIIQLAAVDQSLQELERQRKQNDRDKTNGTNERARLIKAIRAAMPPGVLDVQPSMSLTYPPGVR